MDKAKDENLLERSLGFVLASDYRKQIMAALDNGPMTGTQLSETTGIHASHVSNTVKKLRERNLVECANPER
ncbi:hypothetical protein AKJ41_06120, partial [candidate division MSBL1 archaeon SCGC-AAA259O05]